MDLVINMPSACARRLKRPDNRGQNLGQFAGTVVPRMPAALLRLLAVAALAAALSAAHGTAAAAPPPLSPSVVGEPPNGEGVFRFPQAVTVSPGGGTVYVADQYSGVVQAFAPDGTPRASFGFRATRQEPGRFGVVGGLAVDRSGHLYVLDAENERVQVLSASDGTPLARFGDVSMFNLIGGNPATGAGISASGIAVFQPPGGAPVVYVADQGNDRVERFVLDPSTLTPAGPPTVSGPSLGLQAPQGLALDPGGTRLYVADDDSHRVVVLDPTSLAYMSQVGSFGTGPGQFQNPYDVAVDDHDPMQLYVADNLNHRVDVFDALGLGFLGTFGHPGYGAGVTNMEIVRSVGALTDVPGGGVDVADTANNRVQAFDGAGNVLAAWGLAGRGAGYVTRPRGVAFAADGSIAVADSFDHRVALFAADGTFTGVRGQVSPFTGFATQGASPGQFSLPAGVAYDAAGNLWVADTGNDRVVTMDAAGQVTRSLGGFSAPLGVVPDGAGGAYVADSGNGRVAHVGSDDAVTDVRTGLAHPAAVALGPGGEPFVADDRSVRNATTGATVSGPGGAATWDHPAGLAFDATGTLYVSERRPATADGARVVRGTPSGGGFAWDTVATEGAGAGQVVEPAGLALSADGGTLLVADTGNNRVLRFDGPGHAPPPSATLRVSADPMTRGVVTSDLPGIACVTDCRQRFGAGRAVTLTATPAGGSVITGWTGACAPAGTAATCTVTMNGDQTAGATFGAAPPPPPPVTTPPPPPPPAPPVRIVGVRLSTHTLRLARRADRRRHRRARRATKAIVTVTLSRAATVTAGLRQGRAGRRQGSLCRPPSRTNRRARRCTRFVALPRNRTLAAPQAKLTFTLTPAFGGRALPPGAYQLTLTALDTDGNRVGPRTASFRIVR
jgi:DNA-binding beta-propeller fold protein YncE